MGTKVRTSRKSRLNRDGQLAAFSRMMVHNFLTTRAKVADDYRGGGGIDPPGRDLDYECGYPRDPDLYTYRRLYRRGDLAKRVVDVWPDECWAVRPALYEVEDETVTKFERAWTKLLRRVNVWHYLHRADKLSGIGRFGVVLLGFDDNKTLDMPVDGLNRRGEVSTKRPKKAINLVYMQTYSEENVDISEIETDKSNPRYGQPRYYQVRTENPLSFAVDTAETETIRVHWTRIVHLADNREDSDLVGVPRMEPVLNRLLDLRKTLGGSAEMFWKGAFPGYSFETNPDLVGEAVLNEETVREQFEEYMEGLKRYLAVEGATVKQLLPQVADPTAHVSQQLAAICATLTIPLRIFVGSESGHLASTQDTGTWNKRVARRQTLYVEPMVIRPVVDRLIAVGALPEPGTQNYVVTWEDLNTMSDKDKAGVSLQRAQALMQYVSGGVETILPPFQFYTLVLGLTDAEAHAVMDAVNAKKAESTDTYTDPLGEKAAATAAKLSPKTGPGMGGGKVTGVRPQGGGRVGNPPRRTGGRPSGDVQRNRLLLSN